MTTALLQIAGHERRRVVEALESGLLAPPYTSAALRSVLGGSNGVGAVAEALAQHEHLGLSPEASAVWLRTAEELDSRAVRPDVVWSGPDVAGLHARDTRRVYDELLGSAERSIWASTYVYFDGPRAFEVLARRMDARPELEVRLFLNIQRKWGDTTAPDQLVRRFAEKLWEREWPGSRRPTVFYNPRSLELAEPPGVLHAKAVVADDEALFITSANLTESALDRNIELGLLIRDRSLALSVVSHFRVLIDHGLLTPLPAE